MINKRLLIKNLLAHNDENSFYDKKQQLNLHSKEGKAKFLKHICALSNSNPSNNSYIVVGIEDESNAIVGDDFFDDSKIQNLVNAFLENPPKIQYENVPFPNLPKEKVVGLVTIKPKSKISTFKKGIHIIPTGSTFVRRGSNSIPVNEKIPYNKQNIQSVLSIENNSRNSIAHTLDGVMDFINNKHKGLNAHYAVIKELFVICWAGVPKKVRDKIYFSRVDIELINEQIKLFYSTQDEITLSFTENSVLITEYITLGLNDSTSYYALEEKTLTFFDNGYYKIESKMVFEPPQYNRKMLHHIYNSTLALSSKLIKNTPLSEREETDLIHISSILMICYLNGFTEAKQLLIDLKPYLKLLDNPKVYSNFKAAMRIFRKMKYEVS